MPQPKTPALTTDIIIELVDRPGAPIVLIERRHGPSGWALPGGFVDPGETVEQAAVREAREETSLDVSLLMLLNCYSDPKRDDRGHTASIAYVAQARGEPRAHDDAKGVGIFNIDELPTQLAFDHDTILKDYLNYRNEGRLPRPRQT